MTGLEQEAEREIWTAAQLPRNRASLCDEHKKRQPDSRFPLLRTYSFLAFFSAALNRGTLFLAPMAIPIHEEVPLAHLLIPSLRI